MVENLRMTWDTTAVSTGMSTSSGSTDVWDFRIFFTHIKGMKPVASVTHVVVSLCSTGDY